MWESEKVKIRPAGQKVKKCNHYPTSPPTGLRLPFRAVPPAARIWETTLRWAFARAKDRCGFLAGYESM